MYFNNTSSVSNNCQVLFKPNVRLHIYYFSKTIFLGIHNVKKKQKIN